MDVCAVPQPPGRLPKPILGYLGSAVREHHTDEVLELLAERLVTPLQVEHYLTLAFEQAYRFGEKPVMREIFPSLSRPKENPC